MPSTVVSLRVSEAQAERLQRKARRLGRSPSETGALLLEESLRRDEFAFIDFRDSPIGRQAYILGSRLPVWMVVKTARTHHGDALKTANHLQRPLPQVQAALNYARAFPDEIEAAIKDNDSYDFDRISQMLPQARVFAIPGGKPVQEVAMLRLLLDEHLTPRIARQFRVKWPEAQIESVLLWESGRIAGAPDDLVLAEAQKYGWTLVTYDRATITPLLKTWAEQGVPHGGVILVDERTIAQNDIGGIIRALGALWSHEHSADWQNAVIYLTRP